MRNRSTETNSLRRLGEGGNAVPGADGAEVEASAGEGGAELRSGGERG